MESTEALGLSGLCGRYEEKKGKNLMKNKPKSCLYHLEIINEKIIKIAKMVQWPYEHHK